MTRLVQRVQRLETQHLATLLPALKAECDRLALFYGREAFREPWDRVLAPFSDAQLEVLCAAMDAWQGKGGTTGLHIPTLEALITAFRHHWTGASP